MSLILSFKPGDGLQIGDQKFDVETAERRLRAEDGTVYDIASQSTSPLPGIRVQLAEAAFDSELMLAISAPRHVRITRIRKGGSV